MSILSGFKSYEKYIKLPTGYQKMSERTHAKDILFDDDKSLIEKLGSINIAGIGTSITDAISKLKGYIDTNTQKISTVETTVNNNSSGVNNSIASLNGEITNLRSITDSLISKDSSLSTAINSAASDIDALRKSFGGYDLKVLSSAEYAASNKSNSTIYFVLY